LQRRLPRDPAAAKPPLNPTPHPHVDGLHRPSRALADLAAPKGRLVGSEIAVSDPEIPLQFNGVACSQWDHGLQPDGGGQRDMCGRTLSEGAPDFRRAVQHEPTSHAGRGAGVYLVEQRCAEQVCPVHRCGEQAGPSIECTLVVVVGVIQADLRPASASDPVPVTASRNACQLDSGRPAASASIPATSR